MTRRTILTVVSAVLGTAAIVVIFSSTENSSTFFTSATQLAYNPSKVFTGGSHTSGDDTLGSDLTHTYTGGGDPYPLFDGDSVAMLQGTSAAKAAGWTGKGACVPGLGVEWFPVGGASSRENPLSAYLTPAGQLAGVKITIFGSSGAFGDAFDGPAALGNMVSQGYYIPVSGAANTWEMSVSFRPAADVCSESKLAADIGDRVIINQHTIAKSIPMTKAEAQQEGWQPGSCMTQMGQHHFYDLEKGPEMTFQTGNLLPVTPMYGLPDGKINAIFFSSPACQDDTGKAENWDVFPGNCALPAWGMCANFCNKDCPASMVDATPWQTPQKTTNYATYHVFFNTAKGANDVKCPDDPTNYKGTSVTGWITKAVMGRTCPADTPEAKNYNPDCSWWKPWNACSWQ